jgi:hypothetical protein
MGVRKKILADRELQFGSLPEAVASLENAKMSSSRTLPAASS